MFLMASSRVRDCPQGWPFCLLTCISKDPQIARPPNQHRLSMTSTSSHNIPIRHHALRHHSHSVSLGSVNPSHRVTRRKSMTSTAVNNVAAIAAALTGTEEPLAKGPLESNRRSFTLKSGISRGPDAVSVGKLAGLVADTHPREDVRDQDRGPTVEMECPLEGSAVVDGPATLDHQGSISKARARRASEGAYLSRSEGKRSSAELRCEKCGKGYKHSSCLTKHLLVYLAIYTQIYTLVMSSSTLRCSTRLNDLGNGRHHRMETRSNIIDILTGGSTRRNGLIPQSF